MKKQLLGLAVAGVLLTGCGSAKISDYQPQTIEKPKMIKESKDTKVYFLPFNLIDKYGKFSNLSEKRKKQLGEQVSYAMSDFLVNEKYNGVEVELLKDIEPMEVFSNKNYKDADYVIIGDICKFEATTKDTIGQLYTYSKDGLVSENIWSRKVPAVHRNQIDINVHLVENAYADIKYPLNNIVSKKAYITEVRKKDDKTIIKVNSSMYKRADVKIYSYENGKEVVIGEGDVMKTSKKDNITWIKVENLNKPIKGGYYVKEFNEGIYHTDRAKEVRSRGVNTYCK